MKGLLCAVQHKKDPTAAGLDGSKAYCGMYITGETFESPCYNQSKEFSPFKTSNELYSSIDLYLSSKVSPNTPQYFKHGHLNVGMFP